jgi:hypothetical protein
LKLADFLNDAKANGLFDSAHEVEVVKKSNQLQKIVSQLHDLQKQISGYVQDEVEK